MFINSTDNRFGFKAKHGTDLCSYASKEIVNKYRDNNSSVCMCFIDASKAFDRVNHEVKVSLFKAYSTTHYTARLWCNYRASSLQKLQVAYNDAMRILLRIPRWQVKCL